MLNETPAQLVAHLSHPNGWWRDTAQQLLVLKQDKSVVPALQAMARTSPNILARFHALWTLEGLGALDRALVREQMEDANPRMRIQAVRASETLYKAGDKSLADDYRRLTKDPDANVVDPGRVDDQHLEGRRCARDDSRHDGCEQSTRRAAGRQRDSESCQQRGTRRLWRPRRSAAVHARAADGDHAGRGDLQGALLLVSRRRRARHTAAGRRRHGDGAGPVGFAASARTSRLCRQDAAARNDRAR